MITEFCYSDHTTFSIWIPKFLIEFACFRLFACFCLRFLFSVKEWKLFKQSIRERPIDNFQWPTCSLKFIYLFVFYFLELKNQITFYNFKTNKMENKRFWNRPGKKIKMCSVFGRIRLMPFTNRFQSKLIHSGYHFVIMMVLMISFLYVIRKGNRVTEWEREKVGWIWMVATFKSLEK